MKPSAAASLSSVLLIFVSATVLAEVQVIHAGKLLSVPGQEPLAEQTVVVADGRIDRVVGGYVALSEFDEGAALINLSSSFVMPGLMDMHVHLQ